MSFDPSSLLKNFGAGELRALVETMVLAADADGEFTDDERQLLVTSIQGLAKGTEHESALSGEALTKLMASIEQKLAADGRAKRIEVIKDRLVGEGAHQAALGLAIVVTAADGIVRTSERELIFELAEAFEIDQDTAADLVRQITRG